MEAGYTIARMGLIMKTDNCIVVSNYHGNNEYFETTFEYPNFTRMPSDIGVWKLKHKR